MNHDLRKIIAATNLPLKDIAKGANVSQEMLCDIMQYEKYRPPVADRERIEKFLLPKGLRSTEVRMLEIEKEKVDVTPEPPKPLSPLGMLDKLLEKFSASEIAIGSGVNRPTLSEVKNHNKQLSEYNASKIRTCYAHYIANGKLPNDPPKIKGRPGRKPGSLSKKPEQLALQKAPEPAQIANQGVVNYIDMIPVNGHGKLAIAKSIVTQIGGVLSMAQSFGLEVSNDSIRRIQDAAYYELTRTPVMS